ncbi:hypothetical protein XELAEV_18045821mg [Xenopus laevis]|nr:hypothetical protein XELAEV_18045821mg [Xenopus laevis]
MDFPSGHSHSVRVFSRCAKSDFKWLVALLRSEDFGGLVKEVHAVEISNSYSQFLSDISNCTFAILYHSLNYGRVSLTDVPDSLYDKHLETLSQRFGKKKVIVVIDDLKDSSFQEKRNILCEQPSIGRYSQELLLFSETETKVGNYTSHTVRNQLEALKKTLETSHGGDSTQFPLNKVECCISSSPVPTAHFSDHISRQLESAAAPMNNVSCQKIDSMLKHSSREAAYLKQLEEVKKEHSIEIFTLKKKHQSELAKLEQQIEDLMIMHSSEIFQLKQQVEELSMRTCTYCSHHQPRRFDDQSVRQNQMIIQRTGMY